MRAIILAAGMGTRLRPITLTTPKSLIEVAGETLIERQIRFLQEKGVHEIIVVTGYLAEKFGFLREKYGVTLVHNAEYQRYNNFYTMYLVKDYLADSYVIDADNYLVHNFLLDNPTQSLYFGVQKSQFVDEWVLEIDPVTQRVNEIVIRSGSGRILSGISYWSQTDGQKLKQLMEQYYQQADFADLYWDNVVKENLAQLQVGLFPIEEQDTFEIDSIADLDYLRQQVEKN